MKVELKTRSGRLVARLDVDSTLSVRELKKLVHAASQRLPPARQRLTLPQAPGTPARPIVLEDGKSLADYALADGSTILVKDLGPQVGYSTVFFWEYFGPLIVYPVFYFLPSLAYPDYKVPVERPLVQTLALAYWSFHYAKRILETFTVHKFGHDTMPIANLFRNCTYYWAFAAFISYFNNHPLYTAPPSSRSIAALALAMACQLGNFRCHVILSKLRKPNEKGYKIPKGFLFNYITCANYTCEFLGWLLFTVAVQAVPAGLFALAGFYQMAVWAVQKHKRLQKTFDGQEGRAKYPKRWIILPPFL